MATKNRTGSTGKRSKKWSDRQIDQVFDDVMNFRPDRPQKEVVDEMEELFHPRSTFSVARRIATFVATADGEWFRKLSEDREMALTMAGQHDAIDRTVETLKAFAEMLEGGSVRLMVALCAHDDVKSFEREAKQRSVFSFKE